MIQPYGGVEFFIVIFKMIVLHTGSPPSGNDLQTVLVSFYTFLPEVAREIHGAKLGVSS